MEQPKPKLVGAFPTRQYMATIGELLRLQALAEAGADPRRVGTSMLVRMVQCFQHDPLVQQKLLIKPVYPLITAMVNIGFGVPANRFFKPAKGRPRLERTTLRPCSAVLVDRLRAVGMPIGRACKCVEKAYRKAGVQKPGDAGDDAITAKQIGGWRRALRSHKDDRDVDIYRRLDEVLPAPQTEADVLALVDQYAARLAAQTGKGSDR
jgi:hypothetical protein